MCLVYPMMLDLVKSTEFSRVLAATLAGNHQKVNDRMSKTPRLLFKKATLILQWIVFALSAAIKKCASVRL